MSMDALSDATPSVPHGVADSNAVFLVTHALRGVLSEGTGRRARELLGRGQMLAGKTGTTDGLRDSWFAGYGADRVAVVWDRARRQSVRESERFDRGIGGLGTSHALDRYRLGLRCRSAWRGMALGESGRRTAHRASLRRRDAASVRRRAPAARGAVWTADRGP